MSGSISVCLNLSQSDINVQKYKCTSVALHFLSTCVVFLLACFFRMPLCAKTKNIILRLPGITRLHDAFFCALFRLSRFVLLVAVSAVGKLKFAGFPIAEAAKRTLIENYIFY